MITPEFCFLFWTTDILLGVFIRYLGFVHFVQEKYKVDLIAVLLITYFACSVACYQLESSFAFQCMTNLLLTVPAHTILHIAK